MVFGRVWGLLVVAIVFPASRSVKWAGFELWKCLGVWAMVREEIGQPSNIPRDRRLYEFIGCSNMMIESPMNSDGFRSRLKTLWTHMIVQHADRTPYEPIWLLDMIENPRNSYRISSYCRNCYLKIRQRFHNQAQSDRCE